MFGKKDHPTPDQIKAELAKVTDPELGRDIVGLGMVKDTLAEAARLRVTVELPTPAWEPKELLDQEIRRHLASLAGGRTVEIAWGSAVQSSRPDAAAGQNLIPGARNLVLFASGKGGVGKSTIASNVAAALSSLGANVGLLDADIYGPSIPTMFGTRQMPAIAPGGAKLIPIHHHGLKLMSIGFVVDPKEAMTWRGPMLNGALLQFMRDVEWGDLDYLILDLPPGTGDVQLTIAQNVKVSGACLVSTPQDVALADVIRGKSMFDRVGIPTLGVIENMSSFECTNCGTVHHIFAHGGAAKMAKELGVPLLGEVPLELGVRVAADQGKPEVLVNPNSRAAKALIAIARRIATTLAKQAHAAGDAGGRKPGLGKLKIVQ
ncbi:MAG: Mrp/NBP35 family ATP-binding protein [Deltaproteobacteria bacterium]|nr:Mrp/NBP35 family ATP-binding protein [Deltaproteobacteria bacterium]